MPQPNPQVDTSEVMFVDPTSAPRASTNPERRVVVVEPTPTEAHQRESEDILGVDC